MCGKFKRMISLFLSLTLLLSIGVTPIMAKEVSDKLILSDIYDFDVNENFVLGNTAINILNGGVIAEDGNIFYYSDTQNGGKLIKDVNNSTTCISSDECKNINVIENGIVYSDDCDIKFIHNDSSTSLIHSACGYIDQMYVINNNYIYYLSCEKIFCFDIQKSTETEVLDYNGMCGFVPTEYGIIYYTGKLFNYTVYANGTMILKNVLSFYVDEDVLIYSQGHKDYQLTVKNAFDNAQLDIQELQMNDEACLFSIEDDVEDDLEGITFIDESTSLEISEDEISCPIELFSVGSENVVKRARQQYEIKWTPQKDVVGYSSWTSGKATTFKAKTTYKGIPYGQQVQSGKYVPHGYSLNKFIEAVNDNSGNFYKKRGKRVVTNDKGVTTNIMDSPYYASDCSAFVSWAYGLDRMTTTTIDSSSKIKKVSSQSLYSAKVGDCLNKKGYHVVLITDLIYDESGKLTKVTIMEQTPPKVKKTTDTVSAITKAYLNKGYVLRRYNDIENVKYTHNCAVPLSGDTCTSCGITGELKQPSITSANAESSTSIKVKWGKVSGATKYRVDRRRSDEEGYTTLTSSCIETTYTDSKNLKPGTTYYYRVYAINGSKTSKRSETYKTHTKPDAPVITSVNRDSDTQLTVKWNAVAGATKYKLVYRRGDVEGYEILSANLTGTSYTHKNLKSGSRYWYRVYAIREAEVGAEGNRSKKNIESARSETNGNFTKISKPTNSVDNDNTSHVILLWKKTYGNNDYSYEIWRKHPNESGFVRVGKTKELTYTDTTAVSGIVYTYRIVTVTTNGGSTCTKTDDFYAGSKITKEIVLTPQSATSMKISWDKPISEVGLKYTIQKWDGTEYKEYATTTNTYYVDNNLKTGYTYRYYIQVRDANGKYIASTFGKSAVLEILPTGVSLNKTSATVNEGESLTLTATIIPSNSTNKTLTWTSSNTSVATVSNGVVTSKAEGNTTITVKTSNGKTATLNLTVKPLACTHAYGEWITETVAECGKEGSRYRVCGKCAEKESEKIVALEHVYSDEWTIIKEASCSEAGEKAHLCTLCQNKNDVTVIDKTEHSFSDEWLSESEATCVAEGIEYRLCKSCGEKETRNTEIKAHEYELTGETDVTPDGPGSKTYTCKTCGHSFTEEYVPEIHEGTVAIGSGAPVPGGTVTIPVSINDNPGIAGFAFTVEYDTRVLTPTAITKSDLLTSGTFVSNLEQGIPAEELEEVAVYWGDASSITEDGVLFNITFDVASDAPEGDYIVSLDYEKGDITDEEFSDVMPDVLYNVVTIADVIRGDINMDRRVDSHDGILLSRYLARWNLDFTEKQMQAANVFGDSKVNAKDGVRLSQLLAGYEIVEETESVSLFELNEAKITVASVEGTNGEYVYVPVTISDNDGIAGFNFAIDYDSEYLTPMSITPGDILLDGEFVSNLSEDADLTEIETITAYWHSSDDVTVDGTLFVIEFLVNDNVEVGQKIPVTMSYDENGLCDQYLYDVNSLIEQGTVNVIQPVEPEGDIEVSYTFYISDVYMKSDDGTLCEDIPSNGEFDIFVELQSVTEDIYPATIVVATYDENGTLVSTKMMDITAEVLDEGVAELYVERSTIDISSITVFIWDALNGMKPLAERVEL